MFGNTLNTLFGWNLVGKKFCEKPTLRNQKYWKLEVSLIWVPYKRLLWGFRNTNFP